jgi:transposase
VRTSHKTTKPHVIDVDLDEVARCLERAKTVLPAKDMEVFEGLRLSVVELIRLLRDRGSTIARLRRIFGISSSEKTSDVLRNQGSPESTEQSASPPSGEQPAGSSDETGTGSTDASNGQDAEDNRSGGDGNGDRKSKDTPKGHGRIRASMYQGVRHDHVTHQSLRPGDTCPCCCRSKVYRLKKPACIIRIFGQAPLVAHGWDCERLRCAGCGKVYTARAPKEAQGPKYSESAGAMMAMLRYGTGMPLNRLGHLQNNLQMPVPASTQWEVVRDRAPVFEPVYQELCCRAANGSVIHNDDTYMRILEFMGQRRAALLAKGELPDPDRTGLFTTGIISQTDDGPIVLFFTGRQHAGENLNDLLDRRDPELEPPIHMCDGLDRNLPKDHEVVKGNCLVHGRRHIVDEVGNFPEECRHVILELKTVFENEAKCRKHGWTGEERLRFHQRESQQVMMDLQAWMNAQLKERKVEENSGLGKAYNYLLKRWDKLTLFLRVPNAPIHNNVIERGLKMAIRHRNASLFYRTQRGADVGDMYMTIIYTADLYRENVFEYLTILQLHEADVVANPSAWLPWTYRATLAASDCAA